MFVVPSLFNNASVPIETKDLASVVPIWVIFVTVRKACTVLAVFDSPPITISDIAIPLASVPTTSNLAPDK